MRWSHRRLILIALCCLAAGLASTSLATGFPSALAARTFTGLASGTLYIPAIMTAAVGDYARTSLAAAALGFLTIIFGLGQAIAPPIAGQLADWTQSFSGAFLFASGVAVIGCLGTLSLRPAARRALEGNPPPPTDGRRGSIADTPRGGAGIRRRRGGRVGGRSLW